MIYFMRATVGGPVKIGFTENVVRRHKQLEAHYGIPLTILALRDGDLDDERELHQRFDHLRLGLTEQFHPARELMEFIGEPFVPIDPSSIEAIEPKPVARSETFVLKCRREYRLWINEVAKSERINPAQMVDLALVEYAKAKGHKPPPGR